MPPTPRSVGRSRQRIGVGYTGKVPLDVWLIVLKAATGGVYLKSDLARSHSVGVATAASLGWITNIDLDGRHLLPYWVATVEGLFAYRNRDH